jgi:hypothetical protein
MIFFGISFMISLTWFLIYYFYTRKIHYIPKNQDIQIFLTREERFELNFTQLFGNKTFIYDGDKYNVVEKCSKLNKRGKSLNIYSKGKPQPYQLNYNDSKWLDNKSINSILNNELIPKLLQPNSSWRDILIIITCICSIIACILLIVIALKEFGVIKSKETLVTVQQNNPVIL